MAPYRYVVIVGCGQLGSILANRLSGLGCNVVVVDYDEVAFGNLSTEFSGFQVTGDASEPAILRSAKIDEADCFIAATGHDNVNLMAAQIAQHLFNVPTVIARVYAPSREAIYTQFGIETICPTHLAADTFLARLLRPRGM